MFRPSARMAGSGSPCAYQRNEQNGTTNGLKKITKRSLRGWAFINDDSCVQCLVMAGAANNCFDNATQLCGHVERPSGAPGGWLRISSWVSSGTVKSRARAMREEHQAV